MNQENSCGNENGHFRTILESIADAFFVLDDEWRFAYVNSEAERVLDRERSELLGKSIWEEFPEVVDPKFHAEYQEALRERTPMDFGNYYSPLEIWFTAKAYPLEGELSVCFHDISRRKQLREELRKSEERLHAVLVQHTSDIITIVNAEGVISYETPGVEKALGYKPEDRIGKSIFEFILPDNVGWVSEEFDKLLENGGVSPRLEIQVRAADGTLHYLETTGRNLLADSRVGGVVVNSRDITERKTLEEELKSQALHDSLTGLPNRAMLAEHLQQALARLERREGSVAILFLDLDNFKIVNDSLGHEIGDRLLVSVARRLKDFLRPSDTVARFGGTSLSSCLRTLPARTK